MCSYYSYKAIKYFNRAQSHVLIVHGRITLMIYGWFSLNGARVLQKWRGNATKIKEAGNQKKFTRLFIILLLIGGSISFTCSLDVKHPFVFERYIYTHHRRVSGCGNLWSHGRGTLHHLLPFETHVGLMQISSRQNVRETVGGVEMRSGTPELNMWLQVAQRRGWCVWIRWWGWRRGSGTAASAGTRPELSALQPSGLFLG